MKYDFTSKMNRKGHDAIALDIIPVDGAQIKEGFDAIPMWVADMNFPVLPTIQESIIKRVNEPHFGYFSLPADYFNKIIHWQEVRNNVYGIQPENIGYENGVLGCVASAIQAFTLPGEAILVHSPTYIGFTGVMNNAGRKIVHSALYQDENNIWRMDYDDMDKKCKENNIHFAIFCSPHNPTGRVWEKEEIEKAMEVYRKNDCVVISDEIWSDIILKGYKHIPTQSINEDAKQRTIAIYAPSKTFNLAGLVGSYHIIYNKTLKDRVGKASEMSHYNMANILSVYALEGAYQKEGEEWVNELRETITKNVDFAYDFIQENFKGVKLSKPQGTYMLYLDFTEYCQMNNTNIDNLLKEAIAVGVIWQDGRPFIKENTIRMNLALPFDIVKEAFNRLKIYVIK